MIEAETVDRLVRLQAEDVPVLSMYVTVDAAERRNLDSQITSLLDQVRPVGYDETLDREARLSVREDIARIERAASQERWRPGGLAIFASGRRGVFEEVVLPRAVPDRIVVDSTPWVRPMLAVLDEYHRACVVLISKGTTRVWELYQDEMREATAFRDPTLRKPNFAAWRTENRIHNRGGELTKRHYRRTVDALEQMMRAGGFDVLVLGGQDHEMPAFVESLSRDLRARIAGTFTIDGASASLGAIRAGAESVLSRYERDEEARHVADTLDRHAMGGLAAVGPDDCLWAGSVSAVGALLIHEGAVMPGVVCERSGWLGQSGDICPLCGGPTSAVPDITDELVTAVINDGGSIEHVEAQTPLDNLVVAAQLRFPLPPRPDLHSGGS